MTKKTLKKKAVDFFDKLEQEVSYASVKDKAKEFRENIANASKVAEYRNWDLKKSKKKKNAF